MVRLFVRHPVSDYAAWRRAYDAFDEERGGWGVTGQAVYQSVDDPNDVTVTHDFASREAALEFMDAPRLREVMEEAGVAGVPEVWIATPA
jgi:hypothetical protein